MSKLEIILKLLSENGMHSLVLNEAIDEEKKKRVIENIKKLEEKKQEVHTKLAKIERESDSYDSTKEEKDECHHQIHDLEGRIQDLKNSIEFADAYNHYIKKDNETHSKKGEPIHPLHHSTNGHSFDHHAHASA
jgi:predicted nuclease with TOPRIM domain